MPKYNLTSLLNIKLIEKNTVQSQIYLSFISCEQTRQKIVDLEKKMQKNNENIKKMKSDVLEKKSFISDNYLVFADFCQSQNNINNILSNDIKNQQTNLNNKLAHHQKLLKLVIEKNKNFKTIENHKEKWHLKTVRIKNKIEDYNNDEQNMALFKAKINL